MRILTRLLEPDVAGLVRYTLDVPARAVAKGFDTVLVVWVKGGGPTHAMGHLLLEGSPETDPELMRRVAVRDGLGVK